MRVGVHTVRPPPTPLSNPDVELLTSWGGSSAPGQGHTVRLRGRGGHPRESSSSSPQGTSANRSSDQNQYDCPLSLEDPLRSLCGNKTRGKKVKGPN